MEVVFPLTQMDSKPVEPNFRTASRLDDVEWFPRTLWDLNEKWTKTGNQKVKRSAIWTTESLQADCIEFAGTLFWCGFKGNQQEIHHISFLRGGPPKQDTQQNSGTAQQPDGLLLRAAQRIHGPAHA